MEPLRRIARRSYFTLMHAFEYVMKYEIGSGHRRQYRINQYQPHFNLEQFRKLNEQIPTVDYPLKINNRVFCLRVPLCIFFIMLVKSTLVLSFPALTSTITRRVWLGTEMLQSARVYLETTLVLWSNIGFLFLKIGLSEWTADYKFLAIFAIDPSGPEWLLPRRYGLSLTMFRKFQRFSKHALKLYHLIVGSVSPLATLAVLFLFLYSNLFTREFIFSTLVWMLIYSLWIPCICITLYGNIIAFIVTIRFFQIKSKFLKNHIQCRDAKLMTENRLFRMMNNWNVHVVEIYAEVDEYNRFWSKFLTVLLLNFVMLISQFIYIVLLSSAQPFFKLIYVWVLIIHVCLLSLLISNCGSIYVSRSQIVKLFASKLFNLTKRDVVLKSRDLLKLNNFICEIDSKERGFGLITNYLIQYDTFRSIFVNIAVYFLLMLNSSRARN